MARRPRVWVGGLSGSGLEGRLDRADALHQQPGLLARSGMRVGRVYGVAIQRVGFAGCRV